MYKMDNDTYPTTGQGLAALIASPTPAPAKWKQYLNASPVPQDPWSHDYIYRASGDSYDIHSTGPDGIDGTDDDVVMP